MKFLQEAHDFGVRNIEMESQILAAFTHQLDIPGMKKKKWNWKTQNKVKKTQNQNENI